MFSILVWTWLLVDPTSPPNIVSLFIVFFAFFVFLVFGVFRWNSDESKANLMKSCFCGILCLSNACFTTVVWNNACMINMRMRSIPWGCNFPFKGWSLWGCAISCFSEWNMSLLQLNGVLFQIEARAIGLLLKGVPYSFQRNGVAVKHKGLLRQFSRWWVKHFPHINDANFQMKEGSKKWCYKYLPKTGQLGSFERSVTSFSFKEMVLLSNIDDSWAFKGVLLL